MVCYLFIHIIKNIYQRVKVYDNYIYILLFHYNNTIYEPGPVKRGWLHLQKVPTQVSLYSPHLQNI